MITLRKSAGAIAATLLVLTLSACGALSGETDIASQLAHDSTGA